MMMMMVAMPWIPTLLLVRLQAQGLRLVASELLARLRSSHPRGGSPDSTTQMLAMNRSSSYCISVDVRELQYGVINLV